MNIKHIIVSGSMTSPESTITPQKVDHDHRRQGRYGCGFHYVIERTGSVWNGRAALAPGNHARGYNKESIGICLIGGRGEEGCAKYTAEQTEALTTLLYELKTHHPNATIIGYSQLFFQSPNNPGLSINDIIVAHPRLNSI